MGTSRSALVGGQPVAFLAVVLMKVISVLPVRYILRRNGSDWRWLRLAVRFRVSQEMLEEGLGLCSYAISDHLLESLLKLYLPSGPRDSFEILQAIIKQAACKGQRAVIPDMSQSQWSSVDKAAAFRSARRK